LTRGAAILLSSVALAACHEASGEGPAGRYVQRRPDEATPDTCAGPSMHVYELRHGGTWRSIDSVQWRCDPRGRSIHVSEFWGRWVQRGDSLRLLADSGRIRGGRMLVVPGLVDDAVLAGDSLFIGPPSDAPGHARDVYHRERGP
jgi:hypothetical protein